MTLMANMDSVRAVQFSNEQLILLDQRLLPNEESYLHYTHVEDVAQAITDMVVRGAPAIGITAAYGIVLAAISQKDQSKLNLNHAFDLLAKSRPTAVNLFWALQKMQEVLSTHNTQSVAEQIEKLFETALAIHQDDIKNNQIMGQLGAELIEAGSQVYTHCNAGALATGGYGTALGVIRAAFTQQKIDQVYAGETRPWLQGARLTAWELMRDNIPVTLSTEGAAGQLLRQGDIKWIIVGADRIAANGDVANKIGTYNLAVLAKHHGVKFMVVAPSSTFDLSIHQGKDIPIEARPMSEVTHIQGHEITPEKCPAINPSFDVTPNELIDAIICEQGILTAPFSDNISALLNHSH
ncbi:S-methyl-5-thioribose-1-phosphate isomerase [Oceaniserpentilla sp. 4NH20-0058]|uniref:S-methyl-5-thioribose-1-phosphate isomerase n=1 Tax=Oceaniserpentilla sp. 4NH20-0058 TaxID=3127660 RepID=UPI00310622D0